MKAKLQEIVEEEASGKGVRLFVLRLDHIHPLWGGNKYFKLKNNLEEAKRLGKNTILTFGGAFSNHIYAVAAAAAGSGFKSIGMIRGEETLPLNDTLAFASGCGMKLEYVSRERYREKQKVLDEWEKTNSLEPVYVLPEGGSNELGVRGCMEITNEIPVPFDHICCACGTGATLAGIVLSLKDDQRATGVAVLKQGEFLNGELRRWMKVFNSKRENWTLKTEYHFGGYAKANDELHAFARNIKHEHNIPLDKVYTAKLFYAVFDLLRKDHFKKGERVIIVHSGGMQDRSE